MALAVVQGIRSCEGCSNLPVFIKWPNDVYANTNSGVKKIGGILVNSSWGGNDLTLVIGTYLYFFPLFFWYVVYFSWSFLVYIQKSLIFYFTFVCFRIGNKYCK